MTGKVCQQRAHLALGAIEKLTKLSLGNPDGQRAGIW